MSRSATGGTFCFPSAIFLHHPDPPRAGVGLVPGHARADAPYLLFGERGPAAKAVGDLERPEYLRFAHASPAHCSGEAGQGAVPVAVRDLACYLASAVRAAVPGPFVAEGAR